jgi:hypothetical protein
MRVNSGEYQKHNRKMVEKLTEIGELADILGYEDERSVIKWCRKNKVPLFHIGKKTYTVKNFLDRFISEKLEQFVKASFKNPKEILKAVSEDDKTELTRLLDAPIEIEEKTKFKKRKNSQAADDFMKKLKAA